MQLIAFFASGLTTYAQLGYSYTTTAKRATQFALALLSDIALLPLAGGAVVYAALVKSNFDPRGPFDGKTPILMIHGNGFNEMQWLYGKSILERHHCGPVFTLNLDGLLSNQNAHGIEHYANLAQNKIAEICDLTGQNKITLIGHSMGGLVAAECQAREPNRIEKVITISTPWQETPPLLHFMTRFLPWLFKAPQRYKDMRDENDYITRLKTRINKDKFHAIYSTADMMVPGQRGSLALASDRESEHAWIGHYFPMISTSVWDKVVDWLNS